MSTPPIWYEHGVVGLCCLVHDDVTYKHLRFVYYDDGHTLKVFSLHKNDIGILTPLPDCTGWDWEKPEPVESERKPRAHGTIEVLHYNVDGSWVSKTYVPSIESRPDDPADLDELIHAARYVLGNQDHNTFGLDGLRNALEPKQ